MHKKMQSITRGFLAVILFLSVLMGGCDLIILSDKAASSDTPSKQDQSLLTSPYDSDFDAFAKEIFIIIAKDNEIDLNRWIKNPSQYGIERAKSFWPDLSIERIEEKYDQMQEMLDHLLRFDIEELSRGQRVTYDYVLFYLEGELSIRDYYLLYDPLAYYSGKHNEIEYSLSTFVIRDKDDIEIYFELIRHIDDYVQDLIDYQYARSEAGYFMSSEHARRVIHDCQMTIDEIETIFIEDFEQRIDHLEWLSNREKESYKEENRILVERYIRPAFNKIIQAMTDLENTGIHGRGLVRYEGGQHFYTRQLQRMTGTNRSVDEIFAILESYLDQWESRYYFLERRVSFDDIYSKYLPYRTVEHVIENNLQEMHGRFPMIENLPDDYYVLLEVPHAFEGSIAGMYIYAPIDDPWHNVVYVSRRFSSGLDLYEVVSHEAIPGHLYQTVYFITSDAENKEIRYVLSAKNESLATLEGWTTYIEVVTHGMAGLDSHEKEYVFLHGGIYMLSLAIMDMGIHYYGWSRQDVVNYFRDRITMEFLTIEDILFDQIESKPLQHIAYILGYIDIMEMRTHAQEMLGNDFDEYEFHTFYMDMGMATMDSIKREYEYWLAEQVALSQSVA